MTQGATRTRRLVGRHQRCPQSRQRHGLSQAETRFAAHPSGHLALHPTMRLYFLGKTHHSRRAEPWPATVLQLALGELLDESSPKTRAWPGPPPAPLPALVSSCLSTSPVTHISAISSLCPSPLRPLIPLYLLVHLDLPVVDFCPVHERCGDLRHRAPVLSSMLPRR